MLVPRPHAPPSEKGGVWRRDYIMYEQRTCMNHSMRICMTINEHATCALRSGEVPVTCILLAYRLRGMQLMNHEYVLAVSSE